MADGLLGGFSDFLLGGGKYADSNAINPQYGVPESDVRQAGINTLANVSALLLAAGQPMTGAQRAQVLSQLGPAMGGMGTDIYKSAQARLMNAQMQNAQNELNELNVVRQRQKDDPAGLARMLGIEESRVTAASPKDLREALRSRVMNPYAMETQQLQLEKLRQEIADGAIVKAGNDLFRRVPVSEQNPTGLVRITPPADYGISAPGMPPAGAPPSAAPAGTPKAMFPAATINPNLDYSRAFGVKGAINYLTGKVQGVTTGESQSTAEATKAMSEYDTLRNSLISATSAEVAGKNLKGTQTRIADLLPQSGSFFTSPQEAVNKLGSVKSLIESDMNDLLYIAGPNSRASESDKVKAAQAYRDLVRNRDNIGIIMNSLVGGPAQQAAPQNAPQQGGVREGTIVRNPSTGERKILRGGKWETL